MAILASELRIGNWVHHNSNWSNRNDPMGDEFDFQFNERDWYSCGECCMDIENDLSGIPLTPEILDSIKPNLADYGYVHEWTIIRRLEIKLGYSYITTVKFLHEYQNLFFALTNQELNYTP